MHSLIQRSRELKYHFIYDIDKKFVKWLFPFKNFWKSLETSNIATHIFSIKRFKKRISFRYSALFINMTFISFIILLLTLM